MLAIRRRPRPPEQQARSLRRRSGRGLLQRRCHVALRVSSGSRPVAAIELGQFDSLSLVVRVDLPH